jgi:hypothetical protein
MVEGMSQTIFQALHFVVAQMRKKIFDYKRNDPQA